MDGSNDTIKELPGSPESLAGHPVNLRSIAAILRLADELAEGPKRTSLFMQKYHPYPKGSRMFHRYANVTTIAIDPGNNRIALTYDIQVKSNMSGTISNREEKLITELINYIYKRIIKLDQERKYAKHYCDFLLPFKFTTVTFNFEIKDQIHNLDLPQQFALTDLIVPGDNGKQLPEYNNVYDVEGIMRKIKDVARG